MSELDIDGYLVVADAMHCQRETAEIIVSSKADYLLDAKANQATLENEIRGYVRDSFLRKKMDFAKTTEKNRDRLEVRSAYTTTETDWLYTKEKWSKLSCIGAIKTKFEKNGVKTEEWHYYISSRPLSAKELLHHARMGWSVETMHWLLDVHFDEDFCRIVNSTIQQNLNILRKFALNIIKIHKETTSSKRSISKIMFDCLLNPNALLPLLDLASIF